MIKYLPESTDSRGKMNLKIIIFIHLVMGIIGVMLFFWTTVNKEISIYYMIHFLIIYIVLTVISLILWKYKLFISYFISLLLYSYYLLLVIDTEDESFWLYYLFLLMPMAVIFLAHVVLIDVIVKGFKKEFKL